jgi:hypothetical protein
LKRGDSVAVRSVIAGILRPLLGSLQCWRGDEPLKPPRGALGLTLANTLFGPALNPSTKIVDQKRLGVASSRARCASIIVASPKLFEPDCKSPPQMQLANALCRYSELPAGLNCGRRSMDRNSGDQITTITLLSPANGHELCGRSHLKQLSQHHL